MVAQVGQNSVEAGEDAHVAGQARGLEFGGVEGERGGGERGASYGETYALGAGGAGGVDEVDGVDAVAAAALGEIDDVVEDGEAAEVVVLADFVRLVTELGDAEAGEGCWCGGVLGAFGCGVGNDELGSGSEDDAVGLGVAAVACVAGGVDEVRAVGVVEDGGAAVVSAVGVGLGEGEVSEAVHGGYCAEEVLTNGIGGIGSENGVGVGDVNGVDGGDVAHEGEDFAVGREVEG